MAHRPGDTVIRRTLVAVGIIGASIGLALPAQAGNDWHIYRMAAARLAQRPALIKPGAWQSPAGPVLVAECFTSYPRPGRELLSCLTQPDPRRTESGVWTLHAYHLNHVNHIGRTR